MFGNHKIIAIDIGASNVKLGVFTKLKSGTIELIDFAIEKLDAEDEGNSYLTLTLRNLMRDMNIKSGPVLLSVSGQQVFSRFVRLPPVGEDKIDQIVRYEAQQNVPFPINEVVWDYQLIGGFEGEVDVMLAAIKADISESVCQAVMDAGLEPEIIDVAPLALYNAVRYNYNQLPACTLVVDMGSRSTDLVFIEEGRVFSRSIPVGGNTITRQVMKEFDQSYEDSEGIKKTHGFVAFGGAYEAPSSEVADKVSKSVRSVMTRLHAEIGRSVNFYRTQQEGTRPALILLTGGSSVLPYTDKFLEEKLNVKVEFLNPFQNVAVSDSIDDERIGSSAHLLGEVVGSSLRKMMTCPIEINLMPLSVKAHKAMKRKMPFFVAAGYCVVLVFAVWCAYFLKLGKMGEKRLEAISSKVGSLETVEGQMAQVDAEITAVEKRKNKLIELAEGRSRWLEVLQAMHSELPSGMWIKKMQLTEQTLGNRGGDRGRSAEQGSPASEGEEAGETRQVLKVDGLAYADMHSSQSVPEFVDRLRNLEMFDAKTDITWLPARGEDYAIQFQIDVVLSKAFQL